LCLLRPCVKPVAKLFLLKKILFCGFEEFIIVLSDNKDWRIYQVGFYCGLDGDWGGSE
jgi:hypothetical protein